MKLAGVELNEFHHIIPGFSASVSIMEAFDLTPNSISRFESPVSISPPEFGATPSAELSSVLAAFRNRYDADGVEPVFRGMNSYWDIGDWWQKSESQSPDKLLFWLDGTLDWQLCLAKLCFLFENSSKPPPKLFGIETTANSYDLPFANLSMMIPKDLQQTNYKIVDFRPENISSYASVWRAFCQGDAQQQIQSTQNLKLPVSTRFAIDHLQHQYPSQSTGLTKWQKTLLENATKRGPEAVRIVGFSIGESQTPDHHGDIYLFDELLKLGGKNLKAPLLKFTGNTGLMRETQVEVLPLAHDVLRGKSNFVELNGIDTWIGGVHLTSENLIYQESLLEQQSNT